MGKTSWLADIETAHTNQEWLEEHLSPIYSKVSQFINKEEHKIDAVEYVLLVFPYVLSNPEIKEWGELINDLVMTQYPPAVSSPGSELRFYVGDYLLLSKEKRTPFAVRASKGRRKRKQQVKLDRRELFESYLILFMTLMSLRLDRITAQKIGYLLKFARTVNDVALYYKTYQIISLVHNRQRRYRTALDLARLSYSFSSSQESQNHLQQVEAGLSAFSVAMAYYGLNEVEQALVWLHTAQASCEITQAQRLQIHLGYVRGVLEAIHYAPQTAVRHIQNALSALENLPADAWHQRSTDKLQRTLASLEAGSNVKDIATVYPLI